jgi:hypothetical protein
VAAANKTNAIWANIFMVNLPIKESRGVARVVYAVREPDYRHLPSDQEEPHGHANS